MPPLDARVLAAILLMGAASVAMKLMQLWEWRVNRKPIIDKPIIDTSTNGGVKAR